MVDLNSFYCTYPRSFNYTLYGTYGSFTPFNRFFLEKIPEVFQINKMIIDVNLPNFIQGLIFFILYVKIIFK